jgi:hypothetical protein
LVNALDSTVREDDFTNAFKFIAGVSFEFSQNVYSNIYQCIDQLQRQVVIEIDPATGMSREISLIPPSLNDNTIDEKSKIATVGSELKALAIDANSAIRREILQYDDKFNEFLAICMSFFNDFLFRKDVDRFRYCIRSLITEYREFLVPPKAQDTDERKERLIKNIRENITVVAGKNVNLESGFAAPRKPSVEVPFQTEDPLLMAAAVEPSVVRLITKAQTFESKTAAMPAVVGESATKRSGSTKRSGYTSNYEQKW